METTKSCAYCKTPFSPPKNSKRKCCSKKCAYSLMGSKRKFPERQCSVKTCNSSRVSKGYCNRHYQYYYHHGFPEIPEDTFLPFDISYANREWIAAIIDGEGCIRMTKGFRGKGLAYWPMISVNNTKKRLLDELLRRTGIGGIAYSDRPKPANPVWTWTVGDRENILRLCVTLLPHLILKRRQARLLLMLPKRHEKHTTRRARIYKLLRSCNKVGR